MKRQQGQRRAILVVALCATVIALNHFLRWPLYDRGVNWILWSQSHSNWFFDWFFLAVTMIIDPSIVFLGAIVMMIMSKKKTRAFIMLTFILFNVYCAALLKAYDCDPRPIWTHKEIRNIGFYCPVEYGNPSGHSWFSAVIGFGVFLEYFGPGKDFINIWLSLFLAILVPMSRMYLGAHSLNQVLEGLTLGLACCLLFTFTLKRNIQQYLNEFNENNMWKLIIVGCHILYVIPFFVNAHQELPDSWQLNIANKCHKEMNENRLNFIMFIANALFVNVATGVGLGYSSLANDPLGKKYLSGKWEINEQKYEFKKGYLIYVLVEVGCLLSGLAVGGLLLKLIPTRLVAFIAISVGGLLSGFIYTAKTIKVLGKLKVIRGVEADVESD